MPGVGDFIPLSSAAFQILVALASGPKHGYAVMGEARLNPGTLYTTIKRLLDDELIRETATPSAADHDDRRRYYSITVLGRRVARRNSSACRALSSAPPVSFAKSRQGERMRRLWVWLLRAYPDDFRNEYGPEMLRALNDRCLEERGASRVWFCLEAIGDVLATAAKERYRMMIQEIVHSTRRLLAQPSMTVIAVLSLALGIGANTTMFSIVYASLLRPIAHPDARPPRGGIHAIPEQPESWISGGVTSADFMDWRSQTTEFEDWHLFAGSSASTVTGAGLPERIRRQQITPGLLDSLAVRPVIGRLFRAGEEAERPAVISEGYWRRRFNADPNVLGRKLIIDGRVFPIVGVIPIGFEILESDPGVEMWTPIDLAPGSQWVQRSAPWLLATAKVKHGSSLERAQAELDRIAANLGEAYPDTNRNRGLLAIPMLEERNRQLGATLYPLLGAVAFVLLIACTNVANLLLTRAIARRREISVRAALGAGRQRLMRELLADGMVLAVPGVLVGLAVAYGGIALFRVSAPPGFPGASKIELNLYVLAFTAAAAALSGILAAFFPALEGSKVDLTEALKDAGRGSAGRKRQRLRSLLVASEIALALILLVGAGLTVSSVYRLQTHETGFDPTNVTIAQLHISGTRYMTDAPQRDLDMRYVEPPTAQFVEHVLREARAIPGVDKAAARRECAHGSGSFPWCERSDRGRDGVRD